jgi:hypothetical protein
MSLKAVARNAECRQDESRLGVFTFCTAVFAAELRVYFLIHTKIISFSWYVSVLLSKNLKIRIYRTIILPIVLYGCETCSLTLKEERRLRVLRVGC